MPKNTVENRKLKLYLVYQYNILNKRKISVFLNQSRFLLHGDKCPHLLVACISKTCCSICGKRLLVDMLNFKNKHKLIKILILSDISEKDFFL
jgi:hypothetical protein